MELFKYIFIAISSYITINALLFKPVDDKTKYKGEINNNIYVIILSFAIFLIIYNKPFKQYRKRIYYEGRLRHYEWMKGEMITINSKYDVQYKEKINIIKRKLLLMKLTKNK